MLLLLITQLNIIWSLAGNQAVCRLLVSCGSSTLAEIMEAAQESPDVGLTSIQEGKSTISLAERIVLAIGEGLHYGVIGYTRPESAAPSSAKPRPAILRYEVRWQHVTSIMSR